MSKKEFDAIDSMSLYYNLPRRDMVVNIMFIFKAGVPDIKC